MLVARPARPTTWLELAMTETCLLRQIRMNGHLRTSPTPRRRPNQSLNLAWPTSATPRVKQVVGASLLKSPSQFRSLVESQPEADRTVQRFHPRSATLLTPTPPLTPRSPFDKLKASTFFATTLNRPPRSIYSPSLPLSPNNAHPNGSATTFAESSP